ncbi:hypothetical protein V8F20_003090 [Naviculisporaceae sp. PSN 640]
MKATYLSHTFPPLTKDTIVVAATHATVELADPVKDGWFYSDYFAINYLLAGTVQDQVWILTSPAPSG